MAAPAEPALVASPERETCAPLLVQLPAVRAGVRAPAAAKATRAEPAAMHAAALPQAEAREAAPLHPSAPSFSKDAAVAAASPAPQCATESPSGGSTATPRSVEHAPDGACSTPPSRSRRPALLSPPSAPFYTPTASLAGSPFSHADPDSGANIRVACNTPRSECAPLRRSAVKSATPASEPRRTADAAPSSDADAAFFQRFRSQVGMARGGRTTTPPHGSPQCLRRVSPAATAQHSSVAAAIKRALAAEMPQTREDDSHRTA